jgi:hypothetical protein
MERPRLRVATLAVAALATIAACGGQPAASILTDPTEILKAALTEAATARSFHIDVSADGQVALDLTGTGVSAPINLTGSTATADVDVAGGDAKVNFSIPGLLGLAGDVIVLDGTGYIKTTITGPMYQQVPMGGATGGLPSPDPSAVASLVAGLDEALAQPGVDPVKGDDVPCGTKTCHTVTIELTPEELAALGVDEVPVPSGLPIPIPMDIGDASVEATFRVEQDTNRLAGLTLVTTLGDGSASGQAGEVTAEVTFSKWDEPVSISAPPPDQIGG